MLLKLKVGIVSDNGLVPRRRQAIIWTNANLFTDAYTLGLYALKPTDGIWQSPAGDCEGVVQGDRGRV